MPKLNRKLVLLLLILTLTAVIVGGLFLGSRLFMGKPEPLMAEAKVLMDAGNYDAAIPKLVRAHKAAKGKRADIFELLYQCYTKKAPPDPGKAFQYLKLAHERDPNNVDYSRKLVEFNLAVRRFSEAVTIAEGLVKNDLATGQSAEVDYRLLAEGQLGLYFAEPRVAEKKTPLGAALKAAELAVQSGPQNFENYQLQMQVLAEADRIGMPVGDGKLKPVELIEKLMVQASQKATKKDDAYLVLGDVYRMRTGATAKKAERDQLLAKAEAAYLEAAKLQTDKISALRKLGQLAASQQQYGKAEGYFKQAIAQAPAKGGGYLGLAQLYVNQNETEKAMQQIEVALQKGEPTDKLTELDDLVARRDLLYTMASSQINKGQTAEADKYLAELAKVTLRMPRNTLLPARSELAFLEGRSELLKRRGPQALVKFQEALQLLAQVEKENDQLKQLPAELRTRKAEYHLWLARVYLLTEQPGKAKESYDQALGMVPENDALRQERIQVLMALREYQDAEKQARLLLARNAKNYEVQILLARALTEMGNSREAQAEARRAIELDAKRPDGYVVLAQIHGKSQQNELAEKAIQDGLKQVSNRLQLYALLMAYYHESKMEDKARALEERVRADEQLTPEQKSSIASGNRTPEELLQQRQAEFDKDPKSASKMAQLASALAGRGMTKTENDPTRQADITKAMSLFKSAYDLALEKKESTLTKAIWDSVWVLLINNDQAQEAEDWIKRLPSEMVRERQIAEALLEMGRSAAPSEAERKGRTAQQVARIQADHSDKSLKLFKEVLDAQPGIENGQILKSMARVHIIRASMLGQDRDRELGEARRTFQRILSSQPQDFEARLQIAQLLMVQSDLNGVLTEVAEVLRRNPDLRVMAQAIEMRAVALQGLSRYGEALQERQKLQLMVPKNTGNLMLVGTLAELTGNQAVAEKAYRDVLALSPGAGDGVLALAQLLYKKGGANRGQADAMVEKFVAETPKENLDRSYLAAAQYYRSTNRSEKSIEMGRKAIAAKPESSLPLSALAGLLTEEGQFDEAVGLLKGYLGNAKIAPKDEGIKIQLAEVYMLSGQDFEEAEKLLTEVLKNDSTSARGLKTQIILARVWTRKASQLADKGEAEKAAALYGQAERQFNELLTLSPGFGEAHLGLAELYNLQLQRDKAKERLKQIKPSDAVYVRALRFQVDMDLSEADVGQATTDLLNLLKIDPREIPSRLKLADLQTRRGYPADAEKTLREGLEAVPGSLRLLVALARAELYQGKVEPALQTAKLLTQAFPDDATAWTPWADITMGPLKKPAEAVAKVRELVQQYPDSLAMKALLIDVLNTNKNYDESTRIIEQLMKDRGPLPVFYLKYADTVQLMKPGKEGAEAARKIVTEGIAKNPDSRELRNGLVLSNMLCGDFDQGAAAAREVLKRWSRDASAMGRLCECLIQLGQFDEALVWAQKAVDIDGTQFTSWNNLAWIWAEHKNSPDKARTFINRGLNLAPRHPDLLDTKGWVEYRAGDYMAAIDALEQSVKLVDSPGVRYHLGMAYKLKGEKTINAGEKKKSLDEAVKNLKQYVQASESSGRDKENLASAKQALKQAEDLKNGLKP